MDAPVPSNIVAASVRVGSPRSGGSGTCVLVANGFGLAITNSHVVSGGRPDGPEDPGPFTLTFPGGRTKNCRLAGRDTRADLAALTFWADETTPYVPITQQTPSAGDAVWQVGYPMGHLTRRQGTIRGYSSTAGSTRGAWGLMPSFPVYSGDSGSGVFLQKDGSLCGVVWGYQGTAGHQQSCCVQINDVRAFYQKVMTDVNIFSPNRRPQQPQAPPPPQQAMPPGAPAMPYVPPAPTTDPGLAAQVAAQQQQINSHGGIIAKLQQDLADLQGRQSLTLAGVEGKVAGLKDLADKLAPVLGNLPQIEARLKAIESIPQIQQVPALAQGLDKAVALIEKVQPVVNTVEALKQQVQGTQQQAQDAKQTAQAAQAKADTAHSTAQDAQTQVAPVARDFPAIKAALATGGSAASILGPLGPWGFVASGLLGLGAGAVAFRNNRQQQQQAAPAPAPSAVVVTQPPATQPQLADIVQAAVQAAQSLQGNPGSMKRGA